MIRFPVSAGEGPRPSVCIVTAELVGPFKNGGIGTSMTGLAQHLEKAGFPVTVLYTGGDASSAAELRDWQERYQRIGIAFETPDPALGAALAGPLAARGFTAPYLVYRHLRDRQFDVVNFNDCMGEGVYCLAMKRLGVAFRDTALLVGLHSPSQWIFEINRTPPSLLLFGAFNFAERLSIRLADLLWSPSRYLLDWTLQRGFRHPERTAIQRYVLPSLPLFGAAVSGPSTRADRPALPEDRRPVREIVFFGRLEERKGLRLFCEALSRIEPELHARGIEITFLGKPGAVGAVPAKGFLDHASAPWRFGWKRISDFGQEEALDYLLSRPGLAVIASPADNSPCTVYEALAHGIPFIAARTGGIPELIADADEAATLFDYRPDDLAAKLLAAIDGGIRAVRPAEAPAETLNRWIGGFEAWRGYLAPTGVQGPEREICVLLDGRDGTSFADSIASLDPDHVARIVLIARTPGQQDASTPIPLTIVQPDDPRGLAAALGDDPGEAVLMMRNGTLLSSGAEQALIHALRAPEVDGLVPAGSIGTGAKRKTFLPLGGSGSFCLFEGAAPAGVMIVRAERLALAIKDRELPRETEFLGLADFAVTAGLDIWPYPEPLVHHPQGFVAERPGRSARERLAAYSETDATERLYMIANGYEEFAARFGLGGALRAVKQQLIALGFKRVAEALAARVPERLVARLRRTGRT